MAITLSLQARKPILYDEVDVQIGQITDKYRVKNQSVFNHLVQRFSKSLLSLVSYMFHDIWPEFTVGKSISKVITYKNTFIWHIDNRMNLAGLYINFPKFEHCSLKTKQDRAI